MATPFATLVTSHTRLLSIAVVAGIIMVGLLGLVKKLVQVKEPLMMRGSCGGAPRMKAEHHRCYRWPSAKSIATTTVMNTAPYWATVSTARPSVASTLQAKAMSMSKMLTSIAPAQV